MPRSSKPTGKNEGEGNRTADRNYRAATAKFIKSGRVGPAARAAADALATPEGKKLKKAESAGRMRARS
jgi:hypothetical protein